MFGGGSDDALFSGLLNSVAKPGRARQAQVMCSFAGLIVSESTVHVIQYLHHILKHLHERVVS